METKDQLIKTIKDWLKTDNEIQILKKEIKERKDKNEKLSKLLIETMKSHEINRFDITSGEKLLYKRQNTKKPLNKKKLLELITKFHGDQTIGEELSNFLYDNREEIVKEKIIHKIPNIETN